MARSRMRNTLSGATQHPVRSTQYGLSSSRSSRRHVVTAFQHAVRSTQYAFALVAAVLWAVGAQAADEVKIISPDSVVYRAESSVPGVSTALIDGNPKQGPYTVRAKFAQNVKVPAHFHPDTRIVTVLSGTYYFGSGDKYDFAAIKGYGPGTTIVVPANSPHYAGSAEDGAIVQESGVGPTGITLTGR